MTSAIVLVVILGACFAAAVLNLAVKNQFRKWIMAAATITAVVIGAVYYGFGYAYCWGGSVTSLFRALLALCRMFGGVNDWSNIAGSPLLASELGNSIFWFGHFCAFYVTASAAITTLGEQLLDRIRVTLLRRGPLLLVYGVNTSSVAYARSMAKDRNRSILFVDPDGTNTFDDAIKAFGGVIEKSHEALQPGKRFLKQINMKPGSRCLDVAAMHTEGSKNMSYARILLKALDDAGISPSQTTLLIFGIDEEASSFQAHHDSGYGSVLAFDDYQLISRLIMQLFPPCDRITFNPDGSAAENFHVLILGYGRMGRAMLSSVLMNAVFYGSSFRADIFDAAPQNGFLYEHEIMKHYDINFHMTDGQSNEFYTFLAEVKEVVKCIVLSTGSREKNREMAKDLNSWFGKGCRRPMIIEASKGSYAVTDEKCNKKECLNIYESEIMDVKTIDAMAMQINQHYMGENGCSAEENWEKCSYFSRMSSRASADFYPAVLRAAGKTKEEVLAGNWPPEEEVLDHLAETEHMRWCAFHYLFGWSLMPEDIFRARARAYKKDMARTGSGSINIGKDSERRLHSCLVPWEELDDLSARENEVTGGHVDYKEFDRSNILAVADVLKAESKTEKNRRSR